MTATRTRGTHFLFILIIGSDGCSSSCHEEEGWMCTQASPSICSTICGDYIVTGQEHCDDVNLDDFDGCSSDCQWERRSLFETILILEKNRAKLSAKAKALGPSHQATFGVPYNQGAQTIVVSSSTPRYLRGGV